MDTNEGEVRVRHRRDRKDLNIPKGTSELSKREITGLRLDNWQEDALNHKGHLLLCTGRQVGKTYIFSRKAAEFLINKADSRIIVVSLTEDQAQLMIVMTLTYLENNYKNQICKGKKQPTKNKIQLNNGSMILARPVGNTGDAVRGFTGDVLIIDEASRMPESMFTAAKPTLLTTGGEIWMCSTPAGKQGYFYEAFLNKNNRYKVIHISSEEVIYNRVISDTWTDKQKTEAIKFLEEEKAATSKLEYGQEYLGLFQEDLQRLFSDDLIQRTLTEKRKSTINQYVRHYLGVDIARLGKDDTTYQIIDKYTNTFNNKPMFYHVESIITKKQLTTQTYDKILDLDKVWGFKQIGIDVGSGTLGVGLWDFLLRSTVKRKIIDLDNKRRNLDHRGETGTKLMKEDMYSNLLMLMERGEIKLLNDDEVRLSLASVQWEYVQREGQKTKIRIFGNYTHIVEGIIRATWLATQKAVNTYIDYL